MQKQPNTLCIRCGKVRIFLRTWKAKDNGKGTLITHVDTVCPDKMCQKLVDESFQAMKNRRLEAEERKKNLALERAAAKRLKQALSPQS